MNTPVKDKYEIIDRLKSFMDNLIDLGVCDIGLFGSFASGKQSPTSDIDIYVEFIPEKYRFDNFMELSFLLEEKLGRKVELVSKESLSPHIGPHILKEVEHVSLTS